MSKPSLTLNCDLGEGINNEAEIIPLIDLASVACGGHYGDHESIRETLSLVKRFGKKAGAHPSYPDRKNFGRKSIILPPQDLIQSLQEQISLFVDVSKSEKNFMDHIKFHGALYNDAAENHDLAVILVGFLKNEYPLTPLFVPPNSEIERVALKARHPIKLEVFADRSYLENYKLVSRSVENSLFTKKNLVISHLEFMIDQGKIRTHSGALIPIKADTICIHGDNPGLMEFLPFVRRKFWK
jgi:UPF0271 protein